MKLFKSLTIILLILTFSITIKANNIPDKNSKNNNAKLEVNHEVIIYSIIDLMVKGKINEAIGFFDTHASCTHLGGIIPSGYSGIKAIRNSKKLHPFSGTIRGYDCYPKLTEQTHLYWTTSVKLNEPAFVNSEGNIVTLVDFKVKVLKSEKEMEINCAQFWKFVGDKIISLTEICDSLKEVQALTGPDGKVYPPIKEDSLLNPKLDL